MRVGVERLPEQGGGVKHDPEQKKDTEANDKLPTAAEFGSLVGHQLTEREGAVFGLLG